MVYLALWLYRMTQKYYVRYVTITQWSILFYDINFRLLKVKTIQNTEQFNLNRISLIDNHSLCFYLNNKT